MTYPVPVKTDTTLNETERKSIRGETTKEQAEELLDEGIPIARLPWTSREDA